jgi:hypothetical protein
LIAPVAPETFVGMTVQLKVTPATPLVEESAIEVAVPEQKFWVVGLTTRFGTGFTVTVRLIGEPEQLFAVGVI